MTFFLFVVMGVYYIADKTNSLSFTVEKMEATQLLSEKEIKKNGDIQIKHQGNKTYIYISIGKHQLFGNKNIDFDITKVKESKDTINIYAKETGHCTINYVLKHKIFGILYNGTEVPGLSYENKYKIISINNESKPIKVIWQKHFSC